MARAVRSVSVSAEPSQLISSPLLVKARNWASSATWVIGSSRPGHDEFDAEAHHEQGGDGLHGVVRMTAARRAGLAARGQQWVERGVENVAGGGFDGGVGACQQRLADRGWEGSVEAQLRRFGGWQLVENGAGQGVGADGESVGGVAELAGEQAQRVPHESFGVCRAAEGAPDVVEGCFDLVRPQGCLPEP